MVVWVSWRRPALRRAGITAQDGKVVAERRLARDEPPDTRVAVEDGRMVAVKEVADVAGGQPLPAQQMHGDLTRQREGAVRRRDRSCVRVKP